MEKKIISLCKSDRQLLTVCYVRAVTKLWQKKLCSLNHSNWNLQSLVSTRHY